MRTYLSIDLDYWNDIDPLPDYVLRYLKHIFHLPVPKVIVIHHDQLLQHVNQFKFNHLINIDYHSDLCLGLSHQDEINEGNWLNFVNGASKSHYEWRHPTQFIQYGLCIGEDGDQTDFYNSDKKFNQPWKKPTRKIGIRGISMKDVIAVGISISPAWITKSMLHDFIYSMRKEPFYDNIKFLQYDLFPNPYYQEHHTPKIYVEF
jgi:hypothetical protein